MCMRVSLVCVRCYKTVCVICVCLLLASNGIGTRVRNNSEVSILSPWEPTRLCVFVRPLYKTKHNASCEIELGLTQLGELRGIIP